MSDLISISLIDSPHEEQDWNRQQLALPVTVPKIRFWAYQAPGVVLGCSQAGLVTAVDAVRRAGIPLAGRQAGGGAVLVGPWMLSASILLPVTHPLALGSAVAGYRPIGEAFASVLRHTGIDAHALTPEEARLILSASPTQGGRGQQALQWACYGGLSPWEVVVGRRKIVGLAQVRRRTGVLLAAGLLLHPPDWRLLCRAMDKPLEDALMLGDCTTSCAVELGWPASLPDIAFALRRRLQDAVDANAHAPVDHENSLARHWA